MKRQNWGMVLVVFVFVFFAQAVGHAGSSTAIVINLPSRTLEYYVEGVLTREYPVAIGKTSTPSPLGTYWITDKMINPPWYPPGKKKVIPSGPNNPLGYRWMGFLPTYGIHGTNEPWSIGQVVSNGCIRLREEAVEDLYELVGEGTPVQITYQRFKLRVDPAGFASIGIYPDVYGLQTLTLAEVKSQLQAAGLAGMVEDGWLQQLIDEIPDRQVTFARVHKLMVNGSILPQYAITIDDGKYVPVAALANALHIQLTWDSKRQLVVGRHQAVAGVKRGQTVYVPARQVPNLLGGRQQWVESENCLIIQIPVLKIDNQVISAEVRVSRRQKLVPVLAVAQALQQKITWDEKNGIVHNAIRNLPVQVLGGEPYIDADRIGEFFPAGVVWDDTAQSLTLTEPSYPMDYSMYLDQMGEFF